MSSVIDNDPQNSKQQPVSEKKAGGKITAQSVVIGLLILGAVVLLGYQMFGCEGCYAR